MRIDVVSAQRLWFGPDDPVRAASAVAPFGDGWLIAQDDANHAAWWQPGTGSIERIRLLPPRDGLDLFADEDGTKRLKPDLEAACTVPDAGGDVVLLLGSGSLPPRSRGVLVRGSTDGCSVRSAELAPLYARVRDALGIDEVGLNLEGACVVGDRLRWFQRGHGATGIDSASVDLPLRDLVRAIEGDLHPGSIEVGEVRRYDLGGLGGLPLAITDAVVWHDGRILVSATAEDAPDAVADGPVAGSVLALLGATPDEVEVEILPLPEELSHRKVEGLALRGDAAAPRLLAVVDEDDPTAGSPAVELSLGTGGDRRVT